MRLDGREELQYALHSREKKERSRKQDREDNHGQEEDSLLDRRGNSLEQTERKQLLHDRRL